MSRLQPCVGVVHPIPVEDVARRADGDERQQQPANVARTRPDFGGREVVGIAVGGAALADDGSRRGFPVGIGFFDVGCRRLDRGGLGANIVRLGRGLAGFGRLRRLGFVVRRVGCLR